MEGSHTILPFSFYQDSDVVCLSQALLGKVMVTEKEGVITSGMIVETEAYRAPDDRACHAYQNRRTTRTEIMFGLGGHAYVYLCYGIHYLFNVVTGPAEHAQAVLIRAIQPIENVPTMAVRRRRPTRPYQMSSGPGKLTQALGIDGSDNGQALYETTSPVRIEDHGFEVAETDIIASERVGIAYAGLCAHWPWRFRIRQNPWTSMPDAVKYDGVSAAVRR